MRQLIWICLFPSFFASFVSLFCLKNSGLFLSLCSFWLWSLCWGNGDSHPAAKRPSNVAAPRAFLSRVGIHHKLVSKTWSSSLLCSVAVLQNHCPFPSSPSLVYSPPLIRPLYLFPPSNPIHFNLSCVILIGKRIHTCISLCCCSVYKN